LALQTLIQMPNATEAVLRLSELLICNVSTNTMFVGLPLASAAAR